MSEQNYIERYWRDATPADAIKEPPMVARFRIDEHDKWSICELHGVDRSIAFRWRGKRYSGKQCQVYDAPDPGEGWRLVDVETEKPQEGDEFFAVSSKAWCLCNEQTLRAGYARHAIIRRRIEPPKPKYVPFTWGDREQLRGRWITREKDGYVIEEIAYRFDSRAFEVVAKNLLQDWHFLDTGEPVGKKVVQ